MELHILGKVGFSNGCPECVLFHLGKLLSKKHPPATDPANFPGSALKLDLCHRIPLKNILMVCFHNGFIKIIKGKNGVNADEDMKKVLEKPVIWRPDSKGEWW